MKKFDNAWIFQAFEDHASFFTKRMFGGLAAYLFGRMMIVLVQPTMTGRWKWNGVLICTEYEHQPAIIEEFPQLAPHDVLRKWLYIDSRHDDFEATIERITGAIARDDRRFGIHPHPKKKVPDHGLAVNVVRNHESANRSARSLRGSGMSRARAHA